MNEMPEMRAEEQPSRQPGAGRRGSAAWGGIALIVLGSYFFLMSADVVSGNFNWWAIFILMPALSMLYGAWQLFRNSGGQLTYAVRNTLIPGLVTLLVAVMFLFNLDWSIYWPLFIVVPALGVLLNGLRLGSPDEPQGTLARRIPVMWAGWVGFAGVLLGAAFLLINLGYFDPAEWLGGNANWWALFIAIPAVGGLVNGLRVAADAESRSPFALLSLFGGALVFLAVAGVAWFNLNWNLLAPVILIGLGILVMLGVFGRTGGRPETA